MDVTATAPAEEEERAPFRISFFVVYPKSRALVLLYRQFPRSLALALALSLSFSLFALSFKRGGYQSLLSTQETLSVDDRRCEEEVLFCYAKEGAGPISKEKNKHQMPKMPNAKCQMPKNGSKQKKTKKTNRKQKHKTKQKQKQKQPIPRGARNETNER